MSMWYINRLFDVYEEIKKAENGKSHDFKLIVEQLVEQQNINEDSF